MAYEQYRRWIIDSFPGTGRGPVLDLVAGSFAGGTAVLFTYPLDLVRTKLAYQVPPPPPTHSLSPPLSQTHTHRGACIHNNTILPYTHDVCASRMI